MDAKKRDEAAVNDPTNETVEAAKRLQLVVKRMKKLRAGVKGGDSPGSTGWMQDA